MFNQYRLMMAHVCAPPHLRVFRLFGDTDEMLPK